MSGGYLWAFVAVTFVMVMAAVYLVVKYAVVDGINESRLFPDISKGKDGDVAADDKDASESANGGKETREGMALRKHDATALAVIGACLIIMVMIAVVGVGAMDASIPAGSF